jgi:hypothetical protein
MNAIELSDLEVYRDILVHVIGNLESPDHWMSQRCLDLM